MDCHWNGQTAGVVVDVEAILVVEAGQGVGFEEVEDVESGILAYRDGNAAEEVRLCSK